MKLKDLKLNPSNPRLIKDEKFKKLCNSIRDFPKMMELRPIVYDSAQGNLILGGNMRFRSCKELGMKEIPDTWVKDAADLSEEEKKRFIAIDNVEFGSWDFSLLTANFDTSDLLIWGMDEKDFGIFQIPGENKQIDEAGMSKTENECPKCGFKW